MGSYKEQLVLGRDPVRVRAVARRLLASAEDWTEWERDFLEGLVAEYGSDALTTRQRQKLVELREGAVIRAHDRRIRRGLADRQMLARTSRSRLRGRYRFHRTGEGIDLDQAASCPTTFTLLPKAGCYRPLTWFSHADRCQLPLASTATRSTTLSRSVTQGAIRRLLPYAIR